MALQQNYGVTLWKTLVILSSILFLSGCVGRTPEPEIKVVTKIEKTQIQIASRPKPLQLVDTRVRVVTKDTLDTFLSEFEEQYGNIVFVALSMQDYENLALNIADLKRYINQQKEIIVYYEKIATDEEDGASIEIKN